MALALLVSHPAWLAHDREAIAAGSAAAVPAPRLATFVPAAEVMLPTLERIKPGQPQQNGRHERMHLTLKQETTRPPGMNSLQQQARFDAFVQEFNAERPHEALAM